MKPVIFVDMDGVVADFHTSACALHGMTMEQMAENYGTYWSGDRFWQPIHDGGAEFWENIKPLPWAYALIDLVRSLCDDNWYFLSSPSNQPSCHAGKVQWIHRFMGSDFNRMLLTPYKHLLAQPNHILIDDHEITVTRFNIEGGQTVLFPSSMNILKDSHCVKDPINYVTPLLEGVVQCI